jgi:NAD(P)-dependent dehydrogenase (short-subunit alcohol dehydrogenase family)/rhamnose utilization protein RhaD (predicted bifunctional aldolase and dehydrogenase)
MEEKIQQLVDISRKYGSDKPFVTAGGGNTSFKDSNFIWVKASGYALATISEDGFAVLDRHKLGVLSTKSYSIDSANREEEVKNDLNAACITKDRRPSVETSLHNAIDYAFVVHLHPTIVNGLMCSNNVETVTQQLFGNEAVSLPFIDPGYMLFKAMENRLEAYKNENGHHPHLIFLQNHGIFVGADTICEIEAIYNRVIRTIEDQIVVEPTTQADHQATFGTADEDFMQKTSPAKQWIETNSLLQETIPAIRMILSNYEGLKTLKIRSNSLTLKFASSEQEFLKVSVPFSPDEIVYCKSSYIYLSSQKAEDLLKEAQKAIDAYATKNGYTPKVLVIKGIGLVAVGDHAAGCDIILDVFEDVMKIASIAESFGGQHTMTRREIDFIDNWEVENYRRKISSGSTTGRVQNKTIIVTGAAQGFGEGIAACLLQEGANIVVADLNETVGIATVERLQQTCKFNRIRFVKTDVTSPDSLQNLIRETICHFGGLDVFISNAGILHAGGLDDFKPEVFDLVTKINYNAFFYCAQAASHVMKLQNEYAPEHWGDIIQINSKSGLRGSKANFAYSGSKFGGIGLTQSFALELAPFRIKVNAVCPGNYYEGPLWSNPENGLFKQYLQAGKVPGAKTIDDVREYYMNQVPMRKGTSPVDVTKAILYLIDQTCETGQALPVTGGQVM